MQTLTVNLGKDSYPIYVTSSFNDLSHVLSPQFRGQRILIVTDTNVAPLYLATIRNELTALKQTVFSLTLPSGEASKNMDSVTQILSLLLQHQFSRHCTLIALGGGVIGDITGFAASIYQRGMNFIQIPTTLLAQVDSSVGGKTGINHPLGKNMIGSFKQPKAVWINTKTLTTLSPIDFSSGMAEVIKYGLIRDIDFFHTLEKNVDAINAQDTTILHEIIMRSVAHKAAIVERDEFEQHERALLNLGHTFGHGIEQIQHYNGLSHGQAVSVGIMMAAHYSKLHYDFSANDIERIASLLRAYHLPIQAPAQLNCTAMLQAMSLDKKNINGKLRLILLKSIGQADIVETEDMDLVKTAMIAVGVMA